MDIYQPAFKKLLYDSSGIEEMTKMWLIDELATDPTKRPLLERDTTPAVWPKMEEPSKSIELLRSWDFDVWSYAENQLLPLIEEMFDDFGLLEKFSVPRQKLRNYLLEVSAHYSKKNPYHNFRHAFDVLQTTYCILTTGNAAAQLSYLEIYAILFAALVHDLGHPGLNNNYQVAMNTDLALTYNDKSVLENYHCSKAFGLLKKVENNVLEGLTSDEKKTFRTLVVNSVLATDLANHMEVTGKWNACRVEFKKDESNSRMLLLQIILKCADVANPAKNFEQAKYWAEMVQEEFFAQGDLEKEHELPVSAFMDRENPALARMQMNFIEFLVLPLFSSLTPILPNLEFVCKRLVENKEKWKCIKETTDTI